jgi:hypothetical protein
MMVATKLTGGTMKKLFIVCIALGIALPSWAGQGWYFLRPPIEERPTTKEGEYPWRLVLEAPFRRWWGQSAFDTAAECEAFKQYHVQRAKKGAKEKGKNSPSLDFIITDGKKVFALLATTQG